MGEGKVWRSISSQGFRRLQHVMEKAWLGARVTAAGACGKDSHITVDKKVEELDIGTEGPTHITNDK